MARKDITTLQVLQACRDMRLRTLESLMASTGQPMKVCLAAIMREINCPERLVDCGVSPYSAFLTNKGKDYLIEHT